MYIYIETEQFLTRNKQPKFACIKRPIQNGDCVAIIGGEECCIASYYNEEAAETDLNSIMQAIKDNVKVLDIDSL